MLWVFSHVQSQFTRFYSFVEKRIVANINFASVRIQILIILLYILRFTGKGLKREMFSMMYV